jgi:hypothetical protein
MVDAPQRGHPMIGYVKLCQGPSKHASINAEDGQEYFFKSKDIKRGPVYFGCKVKFDPGPPFFSGYQKGNALDGQPSAVRIEVLYES